MVEMIKWDTVDHGLKRIIAQLRMRAGSSSCTSDQRTPSGSSFLLEQLRGAVVQLTFNLLSGLLDCHLLTGDEMERQKLYQELYALAVDLDLREELQILDQTEHVMTLMLHLASMDQTSDIYSILNQEVKQGNHAMRFFPNAGVLSTYSSVANTDAVELLLLSLIHSTLQAMSIPLTFVLASKAMGDLVADHQEGKCKNRIFSGRTTHSHNSGSECHMFLEELNEYNVAAAKAKGDRLRQEFLEEAQLKPPPVLRVIDCHATCREKQVVLRDWKDCEQEAGYSAISHTYGQEVYSVFNCRCASICTAEKPRWSAEPCTHDREAPDARNATQTQVMTDIINMCAILKDAGVDYVWHDGVCIAQHDDDEVKETIKHIGWVYSNARETIIFLHYVGKPIAPIKHDHGASCRWHTRVWTLQEGALSRCRRYCIRVGTTPIGTCNSLDEFERKVALWYNDDFSRVEVVEEERFFEILKSIKQSLVQCLEVELHSVGNPVPTVLWKVHDWCLCLNRLISTLQSLCFSFPSIDEALRECCKRESKHRGDRINSILALAKVKGFVADKDEKVEASTIQFFARQGQIGLAKAVFSSQPIFGNALATEDCKTSGFGDIEVRKHTWLPSLSSNFHCSYEDGLEKCLEFKVMENGQMEVRGTMVCIKARFMLKAKAPNIEDNWGEEADARKVKVASDTDVTYVPLDVVHYEGDHLGAYRIALFEAPTYYVCMLIMPFLPATTFLQARAGPVIDGHRSLQEVKSFDAYLVLPVWMKARRTFTPALVVQGNPYDQVSKIGVFEISGSFKEDIYKLIAIRSPLHVTKLGKLVLV